MANIKDGLSEDQINQIKIILSDKKYDSDELFARLNTILPILWLDPNQPNKNVAKKHSKQLKELAKAADSFNNTLKKTDQEHIRSINSLSTKFLTDLIEPNNNKTSIKTIPIDAVFRELTVAINTVARTVESYYTYSKWEKAFNEFHNIWYQTIGETPTVSVTSKFIHCLSIIVEQDSETIYKAAQRSEWFSELKAFQEHKTHLKGQTSKKTS